MGKAARNRAAREEPYKRPEKQQTKIYLTRSERQAIRRKGRKVADALNEKLEKLKAAQTTSENGS